jgi:hypothetical protein
MTPSTEAQLIGVLQLIAEHLRGIDQKLASLQSIPSHLNNIAKR